MNKTIFLLKLKQIFTLKRILKGLVSLFLILFFAGGCSFKYMDWQYYKFLRLLENKSGLYIFDKKLYEEIQGQNREFKELPNGEYSLGFLSNGYEILYKYEDYDFKQVYSRISTIKKHKKYVKDLYGAEYIVSFNKYYQYTTYSIILSGDEGGGFHFTTQRATPYLEFETNIFYMENK